MAQVSLGELEEVAQMSRSGASEREVETEIVHIFRQAGWPRPQIRQDVPISDRATDKVDILLNLNDSPAILVEVKRHGQTRDAEGQVRRYCALRRPKIAILTDGVRWIIFYVGQQDIIPILDECVTQNAQLISKFLDALAPERFMELLQSGVFQFLEASERSLQELSETARGRQSQHFVVAAQALLLPNPPDVLPQTIKNVSRVTPNAIKEAKYRSVVAPAPKVPSSTQAIEYDPLVPPNLTWTTIITGQIGDVAIANWNGLLNEAVRLAVKSGMSIEEVSRISSVRLKDGHFKENGYQPLPDVLVSVQGMASGNAWSSALSLAKRLGLKITVTFKWADRAQAFRPGETGVMHWKSSEH